MNKYLLFLIILFAGACKSSPKDIAITKNSASNYRIIYGEKAPVELVQAIQTFKDNLKIVTGADIMAFADIVGQQDEEILIGNSNRTAKYQSSIPFNDLGDNGYFAGVRDKKWIITGNKPDAIITGLFDLLGKLGSTKLNATMTQYEQIPFFTIIGKDRIQIPSFSYRQCINPYSLNEDYRKWNHINIDNQKDWGTWAYSTEKIFPSESYFKSNPEYFAQINNQAVPNQINFSSPTMAIALEKNLEVWTMAKGRATYWSVSPYPNYIVSADIATKKTIEETGSAAGALVKMVNAVAAKNKERTYAIWLDGPYRKAPANITVDKNVMIVLDTKDADYAQSLGEGSINESFRKDLSDWKKLTSNIAVVSHLTNEEYFMMPFPNLTALPKSLKYLKNEGVDKIIFSGVSGTGSPMADLKFYVASHLAYDLNENVDSLISRYCENTYSQATSSMIGYAKALEKAVQNGQSKLSIDESPAQAFKSWLAPNNINQLYSYFNSTTTLAQNNSELKAKLDRDRLSLIYSQLRVAQAMGTNTFGYFMNLGALKATLVRAEQPVGKVNQDENFGIKNAQFKPIQGMKDLLRQFVTDCDAYSIRVVDTKGTTPLQFEEQLLKYIDQNVNIHGGFKKGSIQFNSSTDPEYGDNEGSILNDGVSGLAEFPEANWLGLKGGEAEIIWDLGNDTLVSSISMRFLQSKNKRALLPQNVKIATSTDGSNFKEMGAKSISPSSSITQIENVSFALGKNKLKYIKINLKSEEICPLNTDFAGSPSAILLDEIVLK